MADTILISTAPIYGDHIEVLELVVAEGYDRAKADISTHAIQEIKRREASSIKKERETGLTNGEITRHLSSFVDIEVATLAKALAVAQHNLKVVTRKIEGNAVMSCRVDVIKEQRKPYSSTLDQYVLDKIRQFETYTVIISGTAVKYVTR